MPRLLPVVCLAVACGGGVEDECRATADCGGELECSGVNDGPVCGIAPREQCATDADCVDGNCHAVFDVCSFDRVGSECGPPCDEDTDCNEAFACDLASGSCVATSCDAGFTCAGREECAPERIASNAPVFDRHHGCFAVACSSDAECGERFCVNGTCQDDVGACREPVQVP